MQPQARRLVARAGGRLLPPPLPPPPPPALTCHSACTTAGFCLLTKLGSSLRSLALARTLHSARAFLQC